MGGWQWAGGGGAGSSPEVWRQRVMWGWGVEYRGAQDRRAADVRGCHRKKKRNLHREKLTLKAVGAERQEKMDTDRRGWGGDGQTERYV